MAEKIDSEIETEYICVSRRSLYLASILEFSEDDLAPIFRTFDKLTMERLSMRLQIPHAQLIEAFPDGFSSDLRLIVANKEMKNLVLGSSASHRNRLFGYLRQQEVIGGARSMIVDSGWRATSQNCLQKLASFSGSRTQFDGYYLGLFPVLNPEKYGSKKSAFLFDEANFGDHGFLGLRLVPILETLFSAPHGMTIDYEMKNDLYSPVLMKDDKGRSDDAKRDQLQRIVLEYIDGLKARDLYALPKQGEVLQTLSQFVNSPSNEMAEYLGSFYFNGDLEGVSYCQMAPPLKFASMLYSTVSKKIQRPGSLTSWLEGSAVRSKSRVGRCCAALRRALLRMLWMLNKKFPSVRASLLKRI